MHRSDFEGPPFHWSFISVVGGLVTALLLIIGLETLAQRQHFLRNQSTRSPSLQQSPEIH